MSSLFSFLGKAGIGAVSGNCSQSALSLFTEEPGRPLVNLCDVQFTGASIPDSSGGQTALICPISKFAAIYNALQGRWALQKG